MPQFIIQQLQEKIMNEIYFFKEKNERYFKICCEAGKPRESFIELIPGMKALGN